MRAVFVLFDSLNRLSLECYGGRHVRTPNYQRLSERSVTFDTHYVGSLPCIPARRDMMIGRLNFLHRSWGPLEPFDHAFPETLAERGIYSHLATDHQHYWEDGGATYHTRFDSAELIRGQESDPWKGIVEPDMDEWQAKYHPVQFITERRTHYRRNLANREFIEKYEDYPAVQVFSAGLEFLEINRNADDWFLQIETFDPHEPFDVPAAFRKDYPTNYSGPILDWPQYGPVSEQPDEVAELRANYAATLAHCDLQLGRLLDYFDEHDLWKDTALVLSTDHGFLLGERDLWGKCIMPVYNEVAHIPLMVHHPETASKAGERRGALTQTIDLMPTFLDIFGIEPPPEVQGHSLLPLLTRDGKIREAALYGQHGAAINVTNGRYTYFRYPPDILRDDLYEYTLMPTHVTSRFSLEELRDATLAPPFKFTSGVPVLRVPSPPKSPLYGVQIDTETRLFDLETDPAQLHQIEAPEVEGRLVEQMVALMNATDAPKELYGRFDLR